MSDRSGPHPQPAQDREGTVGDSRAAGSVGCSLLEVLVDSCARLAVLAEDAAWWCDLGAQGAADAADDLRFVAVCGAEQTRSETDRWTAWRSHPRIGRCVAYLDVLSSGLGDILRVLGEPSVTRSRVELRVLAVQLRRQAWLLREHSVITVGAAVDPRWSDTYADGPSGWPARPG